MSPPWVVTTIGTPGAASVATSACGMAQWAWMTSGFAERTTRRIANHCASTSAGTCTMRERRSLRLSRIAPSARSSNAFGKYGNRRTPTSPMRSVVAPPGTRGVSTIVSNSSASWWARSSTNAGTPSSGRAGNVEPRTSRRGRAEGVGRDIVPFRGWRGTVR